MRVYPYAKTDILCITHSNDDHRHAFRTLAQCWRLHNSYKNPFTDKFHLAHFIHQSSFVYRLVHVFFLLCMNQYMAWVWIPSRSIGQNTLLASLWMAFAPKHLCIETVEFMFSDAIKSPTQLPNNFPNYRYVFRSTLQLVESVWMNERKSEVKQKKRAFLPAGTYYSVKFYLHGMCRSIFLSNIEVAKPNSIAKFVRFLSFETKLYDFEQSLLSVTFCGRHSILYSWPTSNQKDRAERAAQQRNNINKW